MGRLGKMLLLLISYWQILPTPSPISLFHGQKLAPRPHSHRRWTAFSPPPDLAAQRRLEVSLLVPQVATGLRKLLLQLAEIAREESEHELRDPGTPECAAVEVFQLVECGVHALLAPIQLPLTRRGCGLQRGC